MDICLGMFSNTIHDKQTLSSHYAGRVYNNLEYASAGTNGVGICAWREVEIVAPLTEL